MKTPKEKAKEILNNMAFVCRDNGNYPEVAKLCALICVDEILNYIHNFTEFTEQEDYNYFMEVKQEIEKL
jgi:hypothetical protein